MITSKLQLRVRLLLFSAVATLVFTTCIRNEDPGGEPAEWNHFYVFVDENGEDFFTSNAAYDPDSVRYTFQGLTEPQHFLSGKFSDGSFTSSRYTGYNVFESQAWILEMIVIFGNGDRDTLTPAWNPSSNHPIRDGEFRSVSLLL